MALPTPSPYNSTTALQTYPTGPAALGEVHLFNSD